MQQSCSLLSHPRPAACPLQNEVPEPDSILPPIGGYGDDPVAAGATGVSGAGEAFKVGADCGSDCAAAAMHGMLRMKHASARARVARVAPAREALTSKWMPRCPSDRPSSTGCDEQSRRCGI